VSVLSTVRARHRRLFRGVITKMPIKQCSFFSLPCPVFSDGHSRGTISVQPPHSIAYLFLACIVPHRGPRLQNKGQLEALPVPSRVHTFSYSGKRFGPYRIRVRMTRTTQWSRASRQRQTCLVFDSGERHASHHSGRRHMEQYAISNPAYYCGGIHSWKLESTEEKKKERGETKKKGREFVGMSVHV